MLAILVPEDGDKQDHLELLALVAELFSDARFRAEMDTGAEPGAVAASFRAGVAQLQASRSGVTDSFTASQGTKR
jgi:PTS system nitrogen regulatory IIA component